MSRVLLHLLLGAAGAGLITAGFARLSGEDASSSFFLIPIVGITCASLAHFLSPWSTPVVLGLLLVTSYHEHRASRGPG